MLILKESMSYYGGVPYTLNVTPKEFILSTRGILWRWQVMLENKVEFVKPIKRVRQPEFAG